MKSEFERALSAKAAGGRVPGAGRPDRETRVRGSPAPGQTPGLSHTAAQELGPSVRKDPVRMAHPYLAAP